MPQIHMHFIAITKVSTNLHIKRNKRHQAVVLDHFSQLHIQVVKLFEERVWGEMLHQIRQIQNLGVEV